MLDAVPVVVATVFVLIAIAFVALPVVVIGGIWRTRARLRTWTPTTARLLRVSQSTRGSRDSRHSVLVGHYEYRDHMGATHQGSGDLGDQGMPVGTADPTVQVVYDPMDPERSMVASPATGAVGCLVATLVVFGLVGLMILGGAVVALTMDSPAPSSPSDPVTEWQVPR
ncbi:DUF3592 domain-containing protein [Nocardioides seonyuensis]|nr:DUF3592 domain-containing protein [Nocardioides seonyuensis]